MRFPPAKLCLLVSSLAFFNFGVFVMFAPRQWRLGRYFRQSHRGMNYSVIPNVTVVGYAAEKSLPYTLDCPDDSGLLVGNVTVNMSSAEAAYWTLSSVIPPVRNYTSNKTVKCLGQHAVVNGSASKETAIFEPIHCRPKHSVAIIVPFRDREEHLRILLGHLTPILQRQLIRFTVFVVSQVGDGTFNKGRLMNTGFEFAVRTGQRSGTPFDCFVFQDVDLLPEYDTLRYRCSEGNVVDHLSTSINKFDYKPLCCGMTVGGVVAFREKQYRKVNGFPNSYWGWGGEDDDINKRIHFRKLSIIRPPEPHGRYTMIKHDSDKLNPWNSNVDRNLRLALRRIRVDGLNNLDTTITGVENFPLFTNVLVDVGKR